MDDLKLYGKWEPVEMRKKFGIFKCAVMIIKRGKPHRCDGIRLPDDKQLRKLLGEEEEGCKSLGVLEADDIKHKVDIKDSVRN